MRLAAAALCLAFLWMTSGVAETLYGDLPLEAADAREREKILAYVGSVAYLDSPDELKYGEIVDVDLVDTTVLIAVSHEDCTQVWLWTVQGEFLEGYELMMDAAQHSYLLASDGREALVYPGKGNPILGLSVQEGQPVAAVYRTPAEVAKWHYVMPRRSAYRIAAWDRGSVTVAAPDGERMVVVDFAAAAAQYQEEEYARMLPWAILILLLFCGFMGAVAWLIRNNIQDPPSPLR